MSKRILVSESEKNSILNMHESYKNYGFIMEDDTDMDMGGMCDVTLTDMDTDSNIKSIKGTSKRANGQTLKVGDKLKTGETIKLSKDAKITAMGIDDPSARTYVPPTFYITCQGVDSPASL
jgi:hypothetical protein